jgi:histidinol-phosphate aminotransferase
MLEAIERHRPAVVYLAYPNNPTGNLFASGVIERMVRASDGLVVVDEAYAAFTDASYMQRLQEFGNLLVMRTVSKLGLAGLRLGMLAGAPAWISEFEKIRLPYNINSLTQVSAEFMLQHPHVFDRQIMAIREERARLAEALDELPQVETFPSETNFILFRVSGKQADQVFNALREQGVLIKNLHKSGGALAGCLRVTVGTPGENDTFLQALRKIL